MMKAAALVTVSLSWMLLAPSAEAESRSWAAVKKNVTPQAAFVIGANLDAIRSTSTFTTLLKTFLDEEADAKQAFDLIKSTCQIDVPAAVRDLTVIMKADEKPLVVFALNNLDETKVVACLEKIGNQMAGNQLALKLGAKKKGKITEYSVPGEREKLYVAWLAADVLAFTDDPNDGKKLIKMLAGKAPKGDLGKWIGKLDTSSPIWFAIAKKEREDIGTIMGGYGQITVSGGIVSAAGHLAMSKPAEAVQAAADAQGALAEAKQQVGTQVPVAKRLLDSVTIAVTGKEVDIGASVADKDIVTLLPELDKIF